MNWPLKKMTDRMTPILSNIIKKEDSRDNEINADAKDDKSNTVKK